MRIIKISTHPTQYRVW